MKLDSEEQRAELLTLLGTVTYSVTANTIEATQAKIRAIMDPIRSAEIEAEEKK